MAYHKVRHQPLDTVVISVATIVFAPKNKDAKKFRQIEN